MRDMKAKAPAQFTRAQKAAYWGVVEDCLVQFHHINKKSAHGKTNAFRKKLEEPPEGLSSDLIYHDEPFYVACDVAGTHDAQEQDRLLTENRARYDSIRASRKW